MEFPIAQGTEYLNNTIVNGELDLNGVLKDSLGSVGVDNQVLTSTGSGVVWSDAGGGGGSFLVYPTAQGAQTMVDTTFNAKIIDASGSSGTNGQILTSTGNFVLWQSVAPASPLSIQTFTVAPGVSPPNSIIATPAGTQRVSIYCAFSGGNGGIPYYAEDGLGNFVARTGGGGGGGCAAIIPSLPCGTGSGLGSPFIWSSNGGSFVFQWNPTYLNTVNNLPSYTGYPVILSGLNGKDGGNATSTTAGTAGAGGVISLNAIPVPYSYQSGAAGTAGTSSIGTVQMTNSLIRKVEVIR